MQNPHQLHIFNRRNTLTVPHLLSMPLRQLTLSHRLRSPTPKFQSGSQLVTIRPSQSSAILNVRQRRSTFLIPVTQILIVQCRLVTFLKLLDREDTTEHLTNDALAIHSFSQDKTQRRSITLLRSLHHVRQRIRRIRHLGQLPVATERPLILLQQKCTASQRLLQLLHFQLVKRCGTLLTISSSSILHTDKTQVLNFQIQSRLFTL